MRRRASTIYARHPDFCFRAREQIVLRGLERMVCLGQLAQVDDTGSSSTADRFVFPTSQAHYS